MKIKKKRTRSWYIKELDRVFSIYIRLFNADRDGIISCVTCGSKLHWKQSQNCHFIGRSNYKYRRNINNCFPGCYRCNVLLKGNYIKYTLYMIDKFGIEYIQEMIQDKSIVKIKTKDIIQRIEFYKETSIELTTKFIN